MEQIEKTIRHGLWLFAALLILAGCTDHDDTTEMPTVDILSRFNAEGNAYLTLQLPLGGGAMTRGVTFDDGDNDEWKVRNAYILIFAGTSEAQASFASAYTVTPTLTTSTNAQITAKATITLNDANINTGDKLYAFVLLNNNSSAITSFSTSSVTFANGTTITTASAPSALQNVTISDVKDADGYFLMTNATLASAATTGTTLTTLVEMPAYYFFATQEEAEANPAGEIYVERLAAKTTVTSGISNYYILGNSYATFVAGDLSFALDNYNTSGYACRHLSAIDYARMVETAPLPNGKHRTYWASDANYSGNSGLSYTLHSAYTALTSAQQAAFWHAMGTSAYCHENTFDVAHMQDDCTTSVLVRLQLNGGTDFYTTSVTGSDIVFQPPLNTNSEEGTSASSSFSRTTRSAVVTYDGTVTATIDDYLRTWLMEQSSALRIWVRDYAGGEPKHLIITMTNNTATGRATATLSQTAQTSGTGYTQFEGMKSSLQALLNGLTLLYYKYGYCYYRVPIRHFDDTQTPWSSAATMTNNTTAQAYSATAPDTPESKYLGRYGMVRNNWYTIGITGVTHVGSPVIPSLTTDADDRIEQLLNATLNIASWTTNTGDL